MIGGCQRQPSSFCLNGNHTKFLEKLNVWCGILDRNVIGPCSKHGTLTTVEYLELLQNQIVPKIKEIKHNPLNPQALHRDVWNQQDGASQHFYFLNIFTLAFIKLLSQTLCYNKQHFVSF